MGYHRQTYIGPYITIDGKLPTIEKENAIKYMTCENPSCVILGKTISGKFCPECGSSLAKGKRFEKYYCESSLYELMDEFKIPDIMYSPEDSDKVLIPNMRSDISNNIIHINEFDGFNVHELSNPDSIIKSLLCDPIYSKFLSFLDGKNIKYTVKYGVISYWS